MLSSSSFYHTWCFEAIWAAGPGRGLLLHLPTGLLGCLPSLFPHVSASVLQQFVQQDLDKVYFSNFRRLDIKGVPCWLTRTGCVHVLLFQCKFCSAMHWSPGGCACRACPAGSPAPGACMLQPVFSPRHLRLEWAGRLGSPAGHWAGCGFAVERNLEQGQRWGGATLRQATLLPLPARVGSRA